jgi:hypothetical protein
MIVLACMVDRCEIVFMVSPVLKMPGMFRSRFIRRDVLCAGRYEEIAPLGNKVSVFFGLYRALPHALLGV